MAVDGIVGGHDGFRAALLHGNLETLQVNFPQSPLRHHRVHLMAAGLLSIAGHVLDGGLSFGSGDSPNHGGGEFSCHQRILGVIFEIPAVQRVAVDIDARPQQRVDLVAEQFPAFHFIQFLHHLHIPGAGQQRSDGYLRGSGAHVHPDAGGTVCRGRHGDPEMIGQSFGNTAEGRGTSRRHPGAAHAFPSGHGRQILVGQLGYKGFQGSPSRLHIRKADSLIAVLRKGRGKIFPDPVSQGRCSCRHLLPLNLAGAVRIFRSRFHPEKTFLRGRCLRQPLRHRQLFHRKSFLSVHRHRSQLTHAGSRPDPVGSRLQHITGPFSRHSQIIVGRHGVHRELHRHFSRLSRRQKRCLRKSCQLPPGSSQLSLWRLHIHLHHFPAGVFGSRILHLNRHGQLSVTADGSQGPYPEAGVGKSVSKGELHLFRTEGFKIPVAHINVLLMDIFPAAAVIGVGRIILQLPGNGVRQLSGRRHFPGQHIRRRVSTLDAALPHIDDAAHRVRIVLLQPAHVNDVGHVHHHHRLLKTGGDLPYHIPLLAGEQIASFRRLVIPVLTGGSSDDDQRLICSLGRRPDQLLADSHLLLIPGFSCPDSAAVVKGMLLQPGRVNRRQLLIHLYNPAIPQAVQQVCGVFHIYRSSRSGAASVKIRLGSSKDGNPLPLFQRQHAALIFQQHRAFRRCRSDIFRKSLQGFSDHFASHCHFHLRMY